MKAAEREIDMYKYAFQNFEKEGQKQTMQVLYLLNSGKQQNQVWHPLIGEIEATKHANLKVADLTKVKIELTLK